MQTNISRDRVKEMARTLQKFLANNPKEGFGYNNALEAVSLMLGFPNHNTLSALLKNEEEPVQSTALVPVKTQTTDLVPVTDPSFKMTVKIIDEPEFDEEHRQMIGAIDINGILHHITLFEVGYGPDRHDPWFDPDDHDEDELAEWKSNQQAWGNHDTRYEALQDFEGVGPGFQTIEWNGREYLCVITPACQ